MLKKKAYDLLKTNKNIWSQSLSQEEMYTPIKKASVLRRKIVEHTDCLTSLQNNFFQGQSFKQSSYYKAFRIYHAVRIFIIALLVKSVIYARITKKNPRSNYRTGPLFKFL